MVKTAGFNAKNKHLFKFPNISSAMRLFKHLLEFPTPSTHFTSDDKDQHMESDVHLPFDDQTKMNQETSPLFSTFN